ncbi:cysteine hydrolase [Liquorilactobacillus satsumensis]|uniref:cysteine hydrolase family protein n=1 Tax=Liquorilactobacillus satsumensis TaxID=259059 RepID=UPI0021C2C0D3|nr:isochorismatase family cysteine hydrolase [Liquorilactobacillus satsumensis]MCP9312620.1 cysteine hydrolase [Liquorilactobacillus satsumensis]MCP9327602.1 cysteine hydrolase [Liquorilactobacillus satsumensis]MCP9361067.1 cysteine hydrolase [Liquorilactobacillus satsumensis]
MPKALLIIDYTNDFVAANGALTVGPPAQELAPAIVDLAAQFKRAGDFVFLPTDVHTPADPYHPETKLFPTHNVRGSWGRELYGPLAQWYAANKGQQNVIFFDKTRYSSFAGTPLDLWLRERQVTEVHLVGVCTDICLLHTAVDAYNLNYPLVIHQKAVATFKPGGQAWALDHFKTVLNAKIV